MPENNPAKTWSRAAAFGALALLPALAVWLNRAKLFYPTAQWDGWALDAASAINNGTFALKPYLVHTPLYLYLLALSQKLGGSLIANARFFDYACWLPTGWLTWALARRYAAAGTAPAAGLAAALLFFTSPLSVQGPLLVDLGDTSLAPLAAAAYYCLVSCGAPAGLLPAALVFALNLWVKLIHPLFLALAALGEALLHRGDPAARRRLLAVCGGVAVFAATWAVYAYTSLNPPERWQPLQYLFHEMLFNFHRQDLSGSFGEVVFSKLNRVFRISLWAWLPLLLWGWRLAKRGFGQGVERSLNYFAILYFAVSVVTKGTSNGFPKYHAVLLPLLCAYGGAFAAEELARPDLLRLLPRLLPAAAAAFLLAFFAGDPFFTFNYGFKAALIEGAGLKYQAGLLALQLLAPAAGFAAAWYACRAALFSLLVSGLAWQAGVGLVQARADYFTTYGYGTTGKAETVEYLAARRGGAVLAPNEFEPELRAAGVPFVLTTDFCQADPACMLKIIRDPATGCFVFGPASNTVGQVRRFLALTEKETGRAFAVERKGDFWIYELAPLRMPGRRQSSILSP